MVEAALAEIKDRIDGTAGAAENLQLLRDPESGVDLAFVQGGADMEYASQADYEVANADLMSLGSLFYEPVWLFYREASAQRAGGKPLLESFADMARPGDWKLNIGAPGSGVPNLVKRLLEANRVEAGKRPLSSMAPTIVYDLAGRVVGVLGSPGGSRIINYVARAALALFAWGLSPAEVAALPHVGSRNGPTELERGTRAESLRAQLEQRGHAVAIHDMTSGLSLIMRRGDEWVGAAVPRREGAARGE